MELSGYVIRNRMEESAMGKAAGLNSRLVMNHTVKPPKIQSVLAQGIVSSGFAQRACLEGYKSNYLRPYNIDWISFFRGLQNFDFTYPAVICLRNGVEENEKFKSQTIPNELLVARRVAPREFIGLGLDSRAFLFSSRSASFSTTLDILIQNATEVWENKPEDALPIYDLTDKSLLWPVKLPFEDLRPLESNQEVRIATGG